MSALGQLAISIVGRTDQLEQSLNDVQRRTEQLGQRMQSVGKSMRQTGATMTRRVTAPLLALGGVVTKFGADFDKAMTESMAIMGEVSEAMEEDMRQAARDVAVTTQFSAEQAAESYFYLASAGMDAADSIEALPRVAEFAQAGQFDMARATDLLTDSQSALGLTVEDTAENIENLNQVSDTLVKANTLANASVEEFADALTNRAAPAMRAANIPLEEGVGVLAAFADQGTKGRRAGTDFERMLRGLREAARNNKEEMAELNVEVFDAEGNMRNVALIIKDLEDALGDMSDEQRDATLAQMGFNAQTIKVLNMLIGTSDEIINYQEELKNAAGITEEVAENQMDTFWAQLGLIRDRLIDVALELWEVAEPIMMNTVIPALNAVIDRLAALAEWFSGLDERLQTAIIAFGGIVAAIGPLLMALGSIVFLVGQALPLLGALAGAIGAIAAAVGAPVVAIGLLVAALGTLAYQNEDVANSLADAWRWIRERAATIFGWLRDYWNNWGGVILRIFRAMWDTILEIFEFAFELIIGVGQIAFGIMTGDWEMLKEGVVRIVQAMVNLVVNLFRIMRDTINDVWELVEARIMYWVYEIRIRVTRGFNRMKNTVIEIFISILEFFDKFAQHIPWIDELVEGAIDNLYTSLAEQDIAYQEAYADLVKRQNEYIEILNEAAKATEETIKPTGEATDAFANFGKELIANLELLDSLGSGLDDTGKDLEDYEDDTDEAAEATERLVDKIDRLPLSLNRVREAQHEYREETGVISEVLEQLDEDIRRVEERHRVYGDEIDVNAEKQRAFQRAIDTLIDEGFAASIPVIQELYEEYKELGQETEEVKEDTEDFIETMDKMPLSLNRVREARHEFKDDSTLIADALDNMDHQLAVLQRRHRLYGDEVDVNAEKQRILRRAIDELIEKLPASSAVVQALKEDLDKLEKQAAETNEEIEETPSLLDEIIDRAGEYAFEIGLTIKQTVIDQLMKIPGLIRDAYDFLTDEIIDATEERLQELEEQADEEVSHLEERRNAEAEFFEEKKEAEISNLEDRFAEEEKRVSEEYDERIRAAREKLTGEIEHDKEIRRQIQKYEEARQEKLTTLEERLQQEKTDIEKYYQAEREQVESEYNNEIAETRQEYDEKKREIEQHGLTGLIELVDSQIDRVLSPLVEALDGVFEIVRQALAPILTAFADILIEQVVPFLIILFDVIAEFVIPIFEYLFEVLTEAVLPILMTFFETIAGPILKVLNTLWSVLAETVIPIFINLFERVLDIIAVIIEGVAPILSVVIEIFGMLLEAIWPIIDTLLAILKPAFELLFAVLEPVIRIIGNVLEPVLSFFGRVVEGVASAIVRVINGIIGLINKIPFVSISKIDEPGAAETDDDLTVETDDVEFEAEDHGLVMPEVSDVEFEQNLTQQTEQQDKMSDYLEGLANIADMIVRQVDVIAANLGDSITPAMLAMQTDVASMAAVMENKDVIDYDRLGKAIAEHSRDIYVTNNQEISGSKEAQQAGDSLVDALTKRGVESGLR